MPKTPFIFLYDIIESIKDIHSYVEGHSKDQFFQDKKTQDAVIRRLQIIGEAVKNIPEIIKDEHPFRWREIASFRDILVHQYASVSLPVVWDIVENELPSLERVILEIKDSLD